MSKLYDEAIADFKKLTEVAEQNAKNRLVDAITPRIRNLIERQLLEGDEFVDTDTDDLLGADDDLDLLSDPADTVDMESEDDFGDVSVNSAVSGLDTDGFGSLEIVDDELEEESESEESKGNKPVNINITVESQQLRKQAMVLVGQLVETKNAKKRQIIRQKLMEIRKKLSLTENKSNKRLAQNIAVILKESKMSRRGRWLFEGDAFGKDGAPSEEIEFDDAGMEDEGDVDLEAVKSAIADLASAVGMAVEDEADMDMGKDGAPGEDVDFDDVDFEDDEDFGADLGEGQMYEIDESMLRNALRKTSTRRSPQATRSSRSLRESRVHRAQMARRRRLAEGEAKAMAKHFGGGTAGKEMFVEVDEATLLNALEKELGRNFPNAQKAGGKAEAKASSFGGGSVKAAKMAEARVREAKRQAVIAERKAAAAQKELKESNTFNAKLLYVTKLMQQHTLNQKQQRAIVEAMDNAKTIREAKLLYTKLNESLNKKALTESKQAKSTLTETRSRTASSNTSTLSEAKTNSGVELDRWAKLAGLKD